MARLGGFRRKTRYKLTKEKRDRGKVSMSRFMKVFNDGDKVFLKLEPSVQKGMFHPRFQGKSGIVKSKKGKCYEVLIVDGNKQKNLLVNPVHMIKG